MLLINHHGQEMIQGAVATGVSMSDLEAGRFRPSYFQYFRGDVDNHNSVKVPQHGRATDGITVMYGASDGQTTLYAFPQPIARFQKPPLSSATADVTARWPAFYQGAYFHMVGHHEVAGYPAANKRRNIQYTRIRVPRIYSKNGWSIQASTAAEQGFRSVSFGKNSPDDPPEEIWSYEEPVIAVTPADDVVIAYGRMPWYATAPRFPDVRYTVWYHDEAGHRPSSALIAGQGKPPLDKNAVPRRPNFVHHAGAVVDPASPNDIWISHVYVKKSGSDGDYQQFIGRVRP